MKSNFLTRSKRYSHTEKIITVQIYPLSFRVLYVFRILELNLTNLAIHNDRNRLKKAFTFKFT
jgi:hypothetical protein